ncbi:hypothetical protein [Streptomyces sp. Ag82_O1-15]|uniref:hypothetical protein n=1 Tax=Streptomyces sp. Ag82_O1-15 TaxID=1938855 RepID=UPI0015C7B213|nr:hypothetical protein [Streptomyces sp. Ag82_O1-15]
MDEYADLPLSAAEELQPEFRGNVGAVRVHLQDLGVGRVLTLTVGKAVRPEICLVFVQECGDGKAVAPVGRTSLCDPALDGFRVHPEVGCHGVDRDAVRQHRRP